MFAKFIGRICRWVAIIFLLAVITSYIQDKNGVKIVNLINSYIESLREKLQQLRMKIVLETDPDGTTWVLSYPGRYLRFPHDFEKV